MFPWFWWINWSPQLHFPLSGAVTQDIYGAIPAAAGQGDVERELGQHYSYGRQLGWLTEAALALQPGAGEAEQAAGQRAVLRLKELKDELTAIQARRSSRRATAAAAALDELAREEPEAFETLLRQLVSRKPPRLTAPAGR